MLMTTNNGEYTNPFYRGAWVLKSFYGDPLETPEDLEISALSPPTKPRLSKKRLMHTDRMPVVTSATRRWIPLESHLKTLM